MDRDDRRKKREEREEKRRKKRTARIISKQREREEREKELKEKVDTPKNEQVAAPKKSEDKSQDSSESSIESRRRKKPVPTLSPEGELRRLGMGKGKMGGAYGESFELGGKKYYVQKPKGYGRPDPGTKIIGPSDDKESKAPKNEQVSAPKTSEDKSQDSGNFGESFELGGKKYQVLRPKGYGPPDPGTKIIGPSDNKKGKAPNAQSQAIQNMGTQKIEDPKIEAESQASQNTSNDNPGTGIKTNAVNAVANTGDPKENTLKNLETAKKIGEGAADQATKNSAAQINNEDLGIALKGQEDEIKATPGASDFTKGGISTTQKPTYDPSGKQVQQDIAKQQKAQTPLAIEKLALQDYFPNAGRNIAVGTFTGSRIGSQTIYSGYGALAPMGLIDARKRAIAEQAKAKRSKLDALLSVPNTYKVYHDFAKPYAGAKFAEIGAKHGWDYDKVMSDPEALKEIYRMKGVYEAFEQAGAAAEELKKQILDQTNEEYIPPRIRKKLLAFTQGQVNPEAYLSGKRDINEITRDLISFPSFLKFYNDNAKTWFASGNESEMPISFKGGEPLTPERMNKIKDGIETARINQDNDAYLEIVKKHFTIDPNIVSTWAKTNGVPLDDEILKDWQDYAFNMMPKDSIERKITHVANNAPDRALGWARLNQEKLQTLSFHNRIAEQIKKNGVFKSGADGSRSLDDRRKTQAWSLQDAGLTNISRDANGVYAITPVPTDEGGIYTPKANSSMLQVRLPDGTQKIVSASDIISNESSYTEDQVTAAKQLRDGRIYSQPDELMYRFGTTDATGATHVGDDAVNGEYDHSIYAAQSGLAGKLETVLVDGVPVDKFVPYGEEGSVRIITNLGNVTKEGAQYNADNTLKTGSKESKASYAGRFPVKQ